MEEYGFKEKIRHYYTLCSLVTGVIAAPKVDEVGKLMDFI